jgi:hypothetical protein
MTAHHADLAMLAISLAVIALISALHIIWSLT